MGHEPTFPNNALPTTYDAIINAVGPAYIVTLNTGITVEDLLLSSANATINHTTGIFSATGAINLNAGTYSLNGGTISNTTINVSGGSLAIAANTANLLSGVSVNGDLNFTTSQARTRIGGGTSFATAHLSGAFAELGFAPGQTLSGSILFEGAFTGGQRYVSMDGNAGTFTIAPTGVIRSAAGFGDNATIGGAFNFGGAMTLTNQGLISSQVSGRTLTIAPASLVQTGIFEAKDGGILNVPGGYSQTGGITRLDNGTLTAGSSAPFGTVTIVSGRLEGRGTINGQVVNSDTIAPGVSPGVLAINGDLTLNSSSKLEIEIGGTTQGAQYDLLTEGGVVPLTLGGELLVRFANGFQNSIQLADSFTIITSNAAISGAFSNLVAGRVFTADGAGFFDVTVSGNNVILGNFVVPEPGTTALLLAGCGLLHRRRARRA